MKTNQDSVVTPLDLEVERTLNALLKATKKDLEDARAILRRLLRQDVEVLDEDGETVPF